MTSTKTRSVRPRSVPFIGDDDGGDDDEGYSTETTAVDPLAAEPLTADEIRRFDEHEPAVDEDLERTMRVVKSGTEVTMAVDVDGANIMAEPTDALLDVRLRPKSRR